jgi:hypothetical protein
MVAVLTVIRRRLWSSAALALQHASILYHLADKDSKAEQIVRNYAAKHAAMEVARRMTGGLHVSATDLISSAGGIRSDRRTLG